jgi:tetratricopeptide (TPR) repeat protein
MAAYSHLRCFVSSTFRDMQSEREELLKFVFPQLRHFCAERGIVWSDVDLRWGITQDQAERGEVLPICLAEIDRCRPLFLCILGERYGWIPPPESLPAGLLAAHPWLSEHPGTSVTELEIRYGALNQEFRQSTHAFFYFHDPRDIDAPPDADRAGDKSSESQPPSRYGPDRLRLLKQEIRLSAHPVRDGYGSPRAFGERVLADLTALIERLVPLPTEQSELDRDAADHEAFARERRDVYVAPAEYTQRLDQFVHEPGDGGRGLLVLGEPGAGKSALLANWLSGFRSGHPDHAVVYHAVGATPQSAHGSAMLRRLIAECRRSGNAPADDVDLAVVAADADPPDPAGEPERPLRLARLFQSVLGRLERPMVIVLDGLERLEPSGGFADVLWLPRVLPPAVRLIVATSGDVLCGRLRQRGWPTLDVEPLRIAERRTLIRQVLRQAGKTLPEPHVERVASTVACRNPLFLRVLLDELRVFGSHERLDERIDSYLGPVDEAGRQQPTLTDLFTRTLERYEQDYDRGRPGLVEDALTCLWASRHGLEETELLNMLGTVEGNPLPQAHWTPLYLAAEHGLSFSGGRYRIALDALREAVQARYLAQGDRHARIARYFAAQEDGVVTVRVAATATATGDLPSRFALFSNGIDARVVSWRRIEELPWQLVQSEQWLELGKLLTDGGFLPDAWSANRNDVETWWRTFSDNVAVRMPDLYRPAIERPAQFESLLDPLIVLLAMDKHYPEVCRLEEYLVNKYRREGDQKRLAAALGSLARSCRRTGDLDRAWDYHREQEELCRSLSDQTQLALCLGGQALILRRRGDLEGALQRHQREEACARSVGSLELLVSSLNNKALVMRELGAPDADLIGVYREIEQTSRRLDDPFVLVTCLFSLLLLQAKPFMAIPRPHRTIDEMRDFYREVFPLAEEAMRVAEENSMSDRLQQLRPIWKETIKNTRILAESLTARGVEAFGKDDLDQAQQDYQLAEEVYRRLRDERGVGICRGELGLIMMGLGDFEGALVSLREEEQICRRLADLEGLAVCLGSQAGVLAESGAYEDALQLLDRQEQECAGVQDPEIAERRAACRDMIREAVGR